VLFNKFFLEFLETPYRGLRVSLGDPPAAVGQPMATIVNVAWAVPYAAASIRSTVELAITVFSLFSFLVMHHKQTRHLLASVLGGTDLQGPIS
jgi:hypothetical protein